MIAAIEWIPKGVANPTPTKYEWSRAEQMFLERVKNGSLNNREEEGDAAENNEDDNGGGDGEWEDMDEEKEEDEKDENEREEENYQTSSGNSKKVVVPKVDINSLPADLRIEEYGDDDEEDGDGGEIGQLLVGKVRKIA